MPLYDILLDPEKELSACAIGSCWKDPNHHKGHVTDGNQTSRRQRLAGPTIDSRVSVSMSGTTPPTVDRVGDDGLFRSCPATRTGTSLTGGAALSSEDLNGKQEVGS